MNTLKPIIEVEDEKCPLDYVCLDHPIEQMSDVDELFESGKGKKKTMKHSIIVTTTSNLLFLLKNKLFKKLSPKLNIANLVVDKVDLHQAMDLEEDLKEVGEHVQDYLNLDSEEFNSSKVVLTTNEQEKAEDFDTIKKAFAGDRKAVFIRLKDQNKTASRFESIGHLLVNCNSELQKYLIFYAFIKLNVLKGRTLIFVDTLFEAYKVKIFLEKFYVRSAVLNPEGTKATRKGAVRYFHAGQYDILILIRMKYSYKLKTSEVVNVVNFTTPQNIQDYNLAARKISFDNGSVLTLTYSENAKVHENKEHLYMQNLEKKMVKRYNHSMFTTLPIYWIEVNRLKSRVDDILCTLTNKKIKSYMSNEIKKQILHSKKLKEYFQEHEEEKEILRSSLETDYKYRHMNKNLDYLPDYCLPKAIVKSEIEQELDEKQGENTTPHVQGLAHDLLFVQNLFNLPKRKETKPLLAFERPDKVEPDKLEFTSGRKLWKLKHKKRVKKKTLKAKDGYSGS